MKTAIVSVCAAMAFALSGCTSLEDNATPGPIDSTVDWRDVATEHDRDRLRQWRTAWVQGLSKAQAAGHGADIAKEGALLQPDAALEWQEPPPGNYRCRVIKIGAKSAGLLDYIAYPAFNCRLRPENGISSFAKLTGSQRPIGLFFPDTGKRMVFLGTLQLGDERIALQYGRDRERDMAGIVERIGEQRWRLALPFPHFESTIDVLELIPATDGPEG